jgi:glycosyltransferase involved in cell wall biosynthesis
MHKPINKMNKKRLLVWCDSPTVPTGFGVVAKNLLKDMHKFFDIAVLGINYFGDHSYDTSKYFIYTVERTDPLGFRRMDSVIKNFKPDIMFMFQDIFHIDMIAPKIREEFKYLPILTYFPIDGSPVSQAWKSAFLLPEHLITYSQWAVDEVRTAVKELPKNKQIEILYHGVDTNAFNKAPSSVRKRIKDERGWTGKFVVLNNNRFQPRKMAPLSFRAFALFNKGYKVCDCGNVYLASKDFCDLNGCDKTHVTDQKDPRPDSALYLHMNVSEMTMGPGNSNLLHAHLINAGFIDSDVNNSLYLFEKNIYNPGDALTESQLNEIYNGADINVTSTIGEGCGLSLLEASATGTTSIAPKNSAIPEVLGNVGHLIPNKCLINIAMDNAHLRPIVDVHKFVQALELEYQKWLENGKHKVINEEAMTRVNEKFLWQDKRDQLVSAIKKLC